MALTPAALLEELRSWLSTQQVELSVLARLIAGLSADDLTRLINDPNTAAIVYQAINLPIYGTERLRHLPNLAGWAEDFARVYPQTPAVLPLMLCRLHDIAALTSKTVYWAAWSLYLFPYQEVVPALLATILGPWCRGGKYRYITAKPEQLAQHHITPSCYHLISQALKHSPEFVAGMLAYATAASWLDHVDYIRLVTSAPLEQWDRVLTLLVEEHRAYNVHRYYIVLMLTSSHGSWQSRRPEFKQLTRMLLTQAFKQRYFDFLVDLLSNEIWLSRQLTDHNEVRELYAEQLPWGPVILQRFGATIKTTISAAFEATIKVMDKTNYSRRLLDLVLPAPINLAITRPLTPVISNDANENLVLNSITWDIARMLHPERFERNLRENDTEWWLRYGGDTTTERRRLITAANKLRREWNFDIVDALRQEGVDPTTLPAFKGTAEALVSLPDTTDINNSALTRLCYARDFRSQLSGKFYRRVYQLSGQNETYFIATMTLLSYQDHRRFEGLIDAITDPILHAAAIGS
jgi:hypothetical protein